MEETLCGRCNKPKPCKCGRPLKFTSVDDLEVRINQYFDECDREEDTRVYDHEGREIEEYTDVDEKTQVVVSKRRAICPACRRHPDTKGCVLVSGELKRRKPYTLSGLAVFLDCSRATLLNYQFDPQFFSTIKAAKDRIEAQSHELLYDRDIPTKGVTFSLSNNHDGWKEKTETVIDDKRDAAEELARKMIEQAYTPRDDDDLPPVEAPADPAEG